MVLCDFKLSALSADHLERFLAELRAQFPRVARRKRLCVFACEVTDGLRDLCAGYGVELVPAGEADVGKNYDREFAEETTLVKAGQVTALSDALRLTGWGDAPDDVDTLLSACGVYARPNKMRDPLADVCLAALEMWYPSEILAKAEEQKRKE